MEIARNLPSYGCIRFNNCTIAYPKPNENASILIGNKELSIQTFHGEDCHEMKFKVIRMRCWRVTTNYGVSIAVSNYLPHSFGTISNPSHIFCRTRKYRRIRRRTVVTAAPAATRMPWNCPSNIWCRRIPWNGSRSAANRQCWCRCVYRALSMSYWTRRRAPNLTMFR